MKRTFKHSQVTDEVTTIQPSSQGLYTLPSFSFGRKTLVAASQVTTCSANFSNGVRSTNNFCLSTAVQKGNLSVFATLNHTPVITPLKFFKNPKFVTLAIKTPSQPSQETYIFSTQFPSGHVTSSNWSFSKRHREPRNDISISISFTVGVFSGNLETSRTSKLTNLFEIKRFSTRKDAGDSLL